MLKMLKRIFGSRSEQAQVPAPAGGVNSPSLLPLDDAIGHMQRGELHAAVLALESVLKLQHDHADAHCLLGQVYGRLGQHEDAADCFSLATTFQPDHAEAYRQLGLLAFAQGRSGEALEMLRKAVTLQPENAKVHNDLGASFMRMQQPEEALAAFRRAVALAPDYANAHSNLGFLLLREFEQLNEAEAHIEEALRIDPGHAGALCNRILVLQYRGQLNVVLEHCDSLIAREINTQEVRLNRALALLTLGDFEHGWPDYEMRKRVHSNYESRPMPYPEWTGQPMAGKTILVRAEQGLGDQIMFASCVPEVAALAGGCILECDAKLLPIFARSFPGVRCYTHLAKGEPGWIRDGLHPDAQVASGSLPRFFRPGLSSFPQHAGYLRADDARVAHWRRQLDALPGKLKVGISWRGGVKSTRTGLRSADLAGWLPVLGMEGVDFVSLQYTECSDELAALRQAHGLRVHHWQEAIDDYDETAALVSALDLVISVQTAVVHLSGALGKPAWVMISAVPEWRYMSRGGTLPWYPAVRLFRQQDQGNWHPVMEKIALELERLKRRN
jgi:tetratricopeptide (TPR) repeat protein